MQLTQFALKKLDLIVDEFWAEISDSIQTIEVLNHLFSILVYTSHQVVSEDDLYPAEVRQQAALVASKVGDSSWSVGLLNGCSGVLPPWLIRRFPAICSGCCHSLRHLRHS